LARTYGGFAKAQFANFGACGRRVNPELATAPAASGRTAGGTRLMCDRLRAGAMAAD